MIDGKVLEFASRIKQPGLSSSIRSDIGYRTPVNVCGGDGGNMANMFATTQF